MNKEKNQKFAIVVISILSVLYAVVSSIVVYKGELVSDASDFLWSIVFAMVIAYWTSNDAKAKDLYKPYEYSYFVFIFWPFVLPYHLVKTRGFEGYLIFVGVAGIYLLPFFTDLVTWVYLAPTS